LLLIATAWLGYNTLRTQTPENLAFAPAEETAPTSSTTTTTTEAPVREWNAGEAEGRYSSSFVHIELIDCTALDPDGAPTTTGSAGINIDETTTLIDSSPLPGANLARVISRTGSTRIALLEAQSSGSSVGYTAVFTRNSLDIETIEEDQAVPLAGETRFFVQFESDRNAISTSSEPVAALPYIAVTNQGEVSQVQIDGRSFERDTLLSLTGTATVNSDAEAPGADVCAWTNVLNLPGAEQAPAELEAAIEIQPVEEPATAETGEETE